MTAVIGIEHGGKVYLAGDSYISSTTNNSKLNSKPKVELFGNIIVGNCGDVRSEAAFKSCLRKHLAKKETIDHIWIEEEFPELVRKEFIKRGLTEKFDSKTVDGSSFLIGVDGRLYLFEDDFSIWRNELEFNAIGAGAPHALGALQAMITNCGFFLGPEQLLKESLCAAANVCEMVHAPFHIICI